MTMSYCVVSVDIDWTVGPLYNYNMSCIVCQNNAEVSESQSHLTVTVMLIALRLVVAQACHVQE